MDISKRLKEARERRGLTQDALAQRANVKKDQISRWENGKEPRDIESIMRIADELDVTLDWLMGRVGGSLVPEGLRALLEGAVRYFTTPLSGDDERWALDFVRSHGDVPVHDWIARMNGHRRGVSDTDIRAEEKATRAAQEAGNALGVAPRKVAS
jgi:transcriptional regulator with XRE-family HTH domain